MVHLNFQATADIIENIPLSIRDRYTLCMSPADSRLPFTRIMLLRVRWKQIFTTEHLRVDRRIKISKNWPLVQTFPGFKKMFAFTQTVHFRTKQIILTRAKVSAFTPKMYLDLQIVYSGRGLRSSWRRENPHFPVFRTTSTFLAVKGVSQD